MASVGFLGGARMQAEKKRIYPPKIETEQKKRLAAPVFR